MTEFISLIIIVTQISMMLFLTVRNLRYKAIAEPKNLMMSLMSVLGVFLIILDCISGENVLMKLTSSMLLLALPLQFLASTVWRPKPVRYFCICISAVQLMLLVLKIMVSAAVIRPDMYAVYKLALLCYILVYVIVYVTFVWVRVRDTRVMIKGGGVLMNLGLSVDIVYAVMTMALVGLMLYALSCTSTWTVVIQAIVAVMVSGMVVAIELRIACDSFFVIMHGHERRIVESMKISQMEIANADRENTYKELYDRIVDYFETDKPFLNNKLTINAVVKVVFSNKLYISRAISQYTGRNFCQFVNYYRIAYSKECFRKNPDLRITEMAEMSGFNSVVSYNMAFRLFMNENPGDWCRKERQKIKKKKK